MGAVAKSYMINGLLIYGSIFAHIRKPFLIYDRSHLNFLMYEENCFFFFISVASGSCILKFYSFPHIIQARPYSATPCEFFARLLLNEFTGAPSFPGCREHRGVLKNTVLQGVQGPNKKNTCPRGGSGSTEPIPLLVRSSLPNLYLSQRTQGPLHYAGGLWGT